MVFISDRAWSSDTPSFRRAIAHDGGNMSGYYILLRLLTALFGTGSFIIRLPSVLAIGAKPSPQTSANDR